MSTVQPETIIREVEGSTIPRTSHVGRISASLFMSDLFVVAAQSDEPSILVNLSEQDGRDLIQVVADALGVEVVITEPASPTCPVCGYAAGQHEGCAPRVVTR